MLIDVRIVQNKLIHYCLGHAVPLRYKPEGRGFDSWGCY